MQTKIVLKTKDDKTQVEFKPELNNETFVSLVNNALNSMPSALLHLYATLPVLRPACKEEQMAHVYVFNEGDKGVVENNLYKYRKHLYETTAAVFSSVLTTAFPDIEYINNCAQYNQTFCMEHNEEEVAERTKEVEEVTKYVRDNFDEIVKSLVEDESHVEEESAGDVQE